MNTALPIRSLLATLPALGLLACGIPGTEADIKFAGVGYDPEEIGAEPTDAGGLIEYTWVGFAGGQLSLAALGLLSFDEAGPDMIGFKPPYGIVNGTAFVFDTPLPSPDAMFGSYAAPPDVVGTCQTVFEPQAYLSTVADVGSGITLETPDGSAGFTINRRPFVYPPTVQNIFPYYSEIASWRATAWTRPAPGADSNQLGDMGETVLARPNYPFGEVVDISWPGGLPPEEATYASVPMPLAAAGGDTTMQLPQVPEGFLLEWTGPRFDPITRTWVEDGSLHQQCLRFTDSDATLGTDEDGSASSAGSLSPADCLELPEPPEDGALIGQIYTPPWKTTDGLTLRWDPDLVADSGDTLSVSIRLLGPVDETDYYFVEDRVFVDPDESIQEDWADLISDLEQDGVDFGGSPPPVPDGERPSLACDPEEDVNWVFDSALRESDGGYIPSLQGDPLHNMVEVTCTLDPSAGEYTISPEQLATALSFADQYGATGAMFYVARTQTKTIDIPPVRDNYGNQRASNTVTAVAKAVQVGRFWYDR